jgi:hypothetical protein
VCFIEGVKQKQHSKVGKRDKERDNEEKQLGVK